MNTSDVHFMHLYNIICIKCTQIVLIYRFIVIVLFPFKKQKCYLLS